MKVQTKYKKKYLKKGWIREYREYSTERSLMKFCSRALRLQTGVMVPTGKLS
jgi:hypothetical protein